MNNSAQQLSSHNMMQLWNSQRRLSMSQSQDLTGSSGSKKQWENVGHDSLLGMATTLFDTSRASSAAALMFPLMNNGSFQQQHQRPVRPEDITSQVLAELSDDLFGPPTDDIFDMEPVPLRNNASNDRNNSHTEQSRFALLEETLNQVLSEENDFLFDTAASTTQAPPMPIVAPSSAESTTMNQQQHKRSLEEQQAAASKRQRIETAPPMTDEADLARRFRPYQAEQWSEKFDELLTFKDERGHCCVPHTFQDNPALARWVKRQRYQYKLKKELKPSTMTDERIIALEKVGFVWDSHGAAWEERLNELKDYSVAHHHANVPSNNPSNPQLATWVKCQRRQYKLFWDGKPSNMTLRRISQLESLGFEWELRGSSNSKLSMLNMNQVQQKQHNQKQSFCL